MSATELSLGDDEKIKLGASSDLEIFHEASNNRGIIKESGTGDLHIRSADFYLKNADGTKTYFTAVEDAEVKLYHNDSERLSTTAAGVTVTGIVTATPPAAGGIGSFSYFTLFSKDSNNPTNTDIDIGAEVVVSTYESGNLHLAANFDDFGGETGAVIGGYGFILSGARAITVNSNAKAVRTTLTGTWRFIGKCAYRSAGSGGSAYAQSQSALAIRIS